MKAHEVLRKYAAGERVFRGMNLKGKSFQGQDLSGADFSEADIRGVNFTNANLAHTNFSGVKAGLLYSRALILVIASLILSGISSFVLGFAIWFAQLSFDLGSIPEIILTEIILIMLAIFIYFTVRKGIVAGTVAFIIAFAVGITLALPLGGYAVVGGGTGAIAVAVGITVAVSIAVAVALALAGLGTGVGAGLIAIIASIIGATGGAISIAGTGYISILSAIALTLLGVYIGWRALAKENKDIWIRELAIAFAATGGTSFCGANLTEANFTGAKLKNTDFRKANLTGVRWYGAKMLDRVRPGDTYLKNTQVRQWLIGKGKEKNFDRQDLRGINLQGANLTDASLISADLSEANLQDADLTRAKLVQTQLDGTDFTGANLTGAFIEDWGITSSTKLDGVRCEYVYMRLPTAENPNPHRIPNNWEENFADNDFADFIKPIVDTLDLYHNQGVDPRAIAISWKQLLENNPDTDLRFASMEVKGENNLLLRLKADSNADLSRLSAEYFDTYNQLKFLSEQELKALIIEKDSRIHTLENLLTTALNKPSFYVANLQLENVNSISNQGAINIEGNIEKIGDIQGIEGINVGGNIEKIGGIQGIEGINIEGNIDKIGDIQESEYFNIEGNIGKIGDIQGNSNQFIISGNTRIETITSGHIEGEVENIQNVQTAELIEPNRRDIKIEIIKGSGMLLNQFNELVLRVTNTTSKTLNSISIELQDSGEYEIRNDHLITLTKIESQESIDISFELKMKVAKEIAVNYKIGNKLQEKPIYIYAVKDNPYIYGSPVEGEVLFFGRKKEFNDIVQAVTKPTKQDILIVGERRTGKTSLLNQINKSFRSPLIPVYIVLNTSKHSTTESVLDLILKQVIDSLTQNKILDKSKINTNNFKGLDFIENIKYIIKIARDNLPDIRVVLLIDEADYLLQIKQKSSNTIDERPQNFLRAVLQSEIGTYLRAVVAGTTELSTYVSQNTSPFFNHFRFLRLRPFSREETRDLIVKPAARLGYKYTEEAIQQIISLSGGLPYYCQALCYESFNNALELDHQEITEDDVDLAQKKMIEDLFNGYLSGFWNRFNELEKRMVVSLTKNRLNKKIDKADIKRLIDWNIIIEDSSGNYRFSSGLIKQWTIMASNQ